MEAALIDAVTAAFRARLIESVETMGAATSPMEFCAAERAVHGLALELAADLTQRVLQEMSDSAVRGSDAQTRVRERASSRGVEVRTERRRKTKVRTLGGQVVEVVTPYATSKPRSAAPLKKRGAQGTGVYPVLDQLGISGRSTPALRLLVSRAVCEANSVASARDLLASSGVGIGHKAALRLTYLVCDDALRARKQAMRAQRTPADHGEFAGRRVVVTVDGGRINIRRRVAGRPRKGGRKHFETEWREPKVLTLYVLGEDGRRDRSVPSVIDGTLGDADAVFELIRYHLFRLGAHRATDVTVVGDGALWIWNRADELRETLGLPRERFQQIVDYFHAVERLGDFSKARPYWTDEVRKDWRSRRSGSRRGGGL